MTGMQWFRLYAEFATDPKVQMMSEVCQRRFVMLLCLRCSNGDVTLHDEEVAFQLRISNEEWSDTKRVFVAKGLVAEDNRPTAWDRRQFFSDSSATRVAKHRQKRREMGLKATDHIHKDVRKRVMEKCGNACIYCGSTDDLTMDHAIPVRRGGANEEANLQVACRSCNADKRHMTHEEYMAWNGRVTLLKRPQNTDTDTDTDTDTSCATSPPAPKPASRFEEFWAAYPKKAERKKAASAWKRRNLDRLADRIIEDVQRRQVMDRHWLDGFIPNPTTYLNGDRWEDEMQTAHKANGSLRIPDGDGPEVRSALWALCKEAGISADEVTAGTPLDAVRRMILERHPMRAAQ